MNRTIREWLELLPSPYKEWALINMYTPVVGIQHEGSIGTEVNPKQALLGHASWSKTLQGHDFWFELSTNMPKDDLFTVFVPAMDELAQTNQL